MRRLFLRSRGELLFLDDVTLTSIPSEDEALRAEVRQFLSAQLEGMTSDARARSWMGLDADFSHALATRGWIGLTLPKEYGGGGRSYFARFVLVEELLAAGAPVAAHWIADRQSGPLIARFGSEAQKRFYLPRICRAEAFFCIGMSEPDTGSDLASVRTRAARADGGWRLNGTKIWTTHAQRAHFMIALVRTSGTPEDRQAGLSQFVIDLSLPGVTVRPIEDLAGDAHFSEVHFEDVFLAEDALIGAEGSGWEQVNAELALERSGPERLYSTIALLDAWIANLSDDAGEADVALAGRFTGRLAVLRAMSISLTSRLVAGESPLVAAALLKDMGTELEQTIPLLIADALAGRDEPPDPVLLRTLAFAIQISPSYSLRGGTREILRGMIARGLGLR
jgi:alkylation response protein AidB-like acyl-CoA dehydrogenase